ncbi:hypothetical protein LCGC14_2559470 [marine sediment metagenome]|uniref:Glycosyltransferase subfamily 4-like N-terminal domain-containing protein n=2 Tax=marine sediment metagenome TaxID=412755 RepID=A0A0F9CWL9_9ZZZZ
MKVAIVIHSNILRKVDGMTNYYNKFCKYIGSSNHKFDIFLQDDKTDKQFRKKSVGFFFTRVKSSFQPLPKTFLSLNPFFYLKRMWVFHKIFKREKYDCIQITSAHPFCFAAALIAKRLNIPVIGFYHTLLPEYVPSWSDDKFNHFPFSNYITKFFCNFVSAWTWIVYSTSEIILTPTYKVKTSMKQKFMRKKIEVVGRGVDSEFLAISDIPNIKLSIKSVRCCNCAHFYLYRFTTRFKQDFHLPKIVQTTRRKINLCSDELNRGPFSHRLIFD